MDVDINYSELREVLKFQVKKELERYSPHIGHIPIVHDLSSRTIDVFDDIVGEIINDAELNKLFNDENIDGIVERLVALIQKHEGTVIPPPYEDIDDWYGEFNHTVNYFVWDHKHEVEREKKEEEERIKRMTSPRKSIAVITQIGAAKKVSGFYTQDDNLIKLNSTQQQRLRWHEHIFELKDIRFNEKLPGWAKYAQVLTEKGETGVEIVQDAINQVEKKYGGFDGYTCDDWHLKLDEYVTDKNRQMVSEIWDLLEQHNLKKAGALDE